MGRSRRAPSPAGREAALSLVERVSTRVRRTPSPCKGEGWGEGPTNLLSRWERVGVRVRRPLPSEGRGRPDAHTSPHLGKRVPPGVAVWPEAAVLSAGDLIRGYIAAVPLGFEQSLRTWCEECAAGRSSPATDRPRDPKGSPKRSPQPSRGSCQPPTDIRPPRRGRPSESASVC